MSLKQYRVVWAWCDLWECFEWQLQELIPSSLRVFGWPREHLFGSWFRTEDVYKWERVAGLGREELPSETRIECEVKHHEERRAKTAHMVPYTKPGAVLYAFDPGEPLKKPDVP